MFDILINVDQQLQQWVASFRMPVLDVVAQTLDVLGVDWRVYACMFMACIVFKKTRRFAIVALSSVVIATVLVAFLKVSFDRPRPFVEQNMQALIDVSKDEYYVSFPSGHTTAIAAIIGSYFTLYKRHYTIGTFCIIFMAWSRMYLHMHYPLDTIVGAIIGLISAYIVSRSILFIRQQFMPKRREQNGCINS